MIGHGLIRPATIYVATTGSDAAAGTEAAPKLTLAGASAIATAGCTVLVRSGTYGLSTFSASGTAVKRITIKPYPGESVTFAAPATTNYDDAVVTISGSYVDFVGFTVTGYGTKTFTVTIASPGVVTCNSHGLSNNQTIRLATSGALPTGLTKGSVTYFVRSAAANTFELSLTSGGASINTSGSQSGTHNFSTGGVGVYCYNTIGTRVLGCTITNCRSSGVNVSGDTIAQSDGNVIANNSISNNSLRNSPSGGGNGWGQGITCVGKNAMIQGNSVFQNYGEGIGILSQTAGQVTTDCVVRGNTVWDNVSVNIYPDNSTRTTIDRNLIYDTGDATYNSGANRPEGIVFSAENFAQAHDSAVVTNNVIIACRNGIYYYVTVAGSGLTNSVVAGNTIINSTVCPFKSNNDSQSSNVFKNNIIYQASSVAYTSLNSDTSWTFSYNGFFGGTGATGTNNVTTDPGLVAPGTLTAAASQITAGSPCYRTGNAHASLTVDYYGTTRPSPPSMGFYEP